MLTIKQSDDFGPRTIEGFVNHGNNAKAIERGTALGTVAGEILDFFIAPEPQYTASPTNNAPSYWDSYNYYDDCNGW